MFFAIAALLIQPQIVPQVSFSAEKITLIEPADSAIATGITAGDTSSQPAAGDANTAVTGSGTQPMTEASAAAPPDAPAPGIEAPVNAAFIMAKPSKPMTVSVGELRKENHRNQLIWRGLVIASSGAATFDAWSTRHAITTQGAQELDPLLKPFAGNASLYLAIQVGPAIMDFAARKMMYSRHGWVRHMWWAPQTASIVGSLFCGAHNLSYHQ
jgi:hypothetical protein